MNKLMIHATTWLNVKGFMLSETQKAAYCMISINDIPEKTKTKMMEKKSLPGERKRGRGGLTIKGAAPGILMVLGFSVTCLW